MHAYLIVGGDKNSRTEKLETILSQKGVAPRPGQRFVLGETETSIKIKDIREAEKWVNLKKSLPSALVVGEADRLTIPAQHAFLKTLEEPGENILIVLTAAAASSLLPTIRSRCKIIHLSSAAGTDNTEKFAKLPTGTVSQRLVNLYPILKQITGSRAGLHRGTIKRDEGLKFLEAMISSWRTQATTAAILEAAAIARRRLKNNLNPTLVLHQFVMDISR